MLIDRGVMSATRKYVELYAGDSILRVVDAYRRYKTYVLFPQLLSLAKGSNRIIYNDSIQLRANLISYPISLCWFRHPLYELDSDSEHQKRGRLDDQTAIAVLFNTQYLPW